jgi:hypothetical protein
LDFAGQIRIRNAEMKKKFAERERNFTLSRSALPCVRLDRRVGVNPTPADCPSSAIAAR